MPSLWNWVLVIGGALLVLVEVSFGGFAGFDLVLIGSALLVGGGAGFLLHNPSLGMIVAGALCALYIVIGRRWVRARLRPPAQLASNVDAVLGREGVVVQRVAPHAAGQVRVGDEVWRAEVESGSGASFEPGTVVVVAGVSGVTLQVRPA